MTKNGKQVRRRRILVIRGLQLKYSLIIAVVTAVLMMIMGVGMFKLYRQHITSAYFLPDMGEEQLLVNFNHFLLFIAIFSGLMVASITGLGVIITHRIAGPIYMLSRFCQKVAKGHLGNLRPLRQKDELKEFHESINLMIGSLRLEIRQDIDLAERVMAVLEKVKENRDQLDQKRVEDLITSLKITLARKKRSISASDEDKPAVMISHENMGQGEVSKSLTQESAESE